MSIAQIIKDDVVTNCIAVDPSAVISADGSKITWANGEYDAPSGSAMMMQAGAGIGWVLSGSVLVAPAAPADPAPTQAQLLAYAEVKRALISDGGVTVNIAAAGAAPLNISSLTDTDGKTDLAGAVQIAGLDPSHVFNWDQDAGSVQLNAAQVRELGLLVGAWVQSVRTAVVAVKAEIKAGTITTLAEIDAFAWPVNS